MKNKKIRILLKIITICIILIMAFSTIVFGEDTEEESNAFKNLASDGVQVLISGFVGILLFLPKLLLLVIALAIQGILSIVLSVSSEQLVGFTPASMLFNQVSLLDINFFSMTASNSNSALYIIKENVSYWYVQLRNLSTAALLIVIAYIGIRMALSTVADDKSKYKKLLKYWVESFALLFVLHYIMVAVIGLNDEIVKLIGGSFKDDTKTLELLGSALMPTLSGVAAAIVYTMTVGVAAAFFIMYLKRVMMVGFLIVIAPLITITYSIDKVGDGKSQALDQWLKLFMYNVLIQPFHCILYLIFVSQAFNLSNNGLFDTNLAGSILSVASMMFIFKAEEILKQIFGFDKAGKSMMSGLVAGSMIGKAAGKVSGSVVKAGKKAGKVVSNSKLATKISNGKEDFKNKYKTAGAILNRAEKVGDKIANNKFTKTATKLAPDFVIPIMTAPSSPSTAFGMLTSSLDSSKEKRKLEEKFDKFEDDVLKTIEKFLDGYTDNSEREKKLMEAYSFDFSPEKLKELENDCIDPTTSKVDTRKVYEHLKFIESLQGRIKVDVEINKDDNKTNMESLKEIIEFAKTV